MMIYIAAECAQREAEIAAKQEGEKRNVQLQKGGQNSDGGDASSYGESTEAS